MNNSTRILKDPASIRQGNPARSYELMSKNRDLGWSCRVVLLLDDPSDAAFQEALEVERWMVRMQRHQDQRPQHRYLQTTTKSMNIEKILTKAMKI